MARFDFVEPQRLADNYQYCCCYLRLFNLILEVSVFDMFAESVRREAIYKRLSKLVRTSNWIF